MSFILLDIALIKLPDSNPFVRSDTIDYIEFNGRLNGPFQWNNKKLYGKKIKLSGWGDTEETESPNDLFWTFQHVSKFNKNIDGSKIIQTGDEVLNFLGEKLLKRGGCLGDSGGRK